MPVVRLYSIDWEGDSEISLPAQFTVYVPEDDPHPVLTATRTLSARYPDSTGYHAEYQIRPVNHGCTKRIQKGLQHEPTPVEPDPHPRSV